MSASEVRAGSAYVEIGAKTKKLEDALKHAGQKLESFRATVSAIGEGMQSIGTKVAAVGIGIAGAMTTAVKSTADLAEQTANLQAKTGASLEAIAGLQSIAADTGVSIETVSAAMKGLQLNLAEGGKQAKNAFERLGLSLKDLQSAKPEEVLGKVADQLSKVTDANERAALAQEVFGRAGRDILPLLMEGSGGLNKAAAEAQRYGTAFSSATLQTALEADRAFDQLGKSFDGLKITIGTTLAPLITPIVDAIRNAVVAAKDWAAQNGPLIQSVFNIATAVGAFGLSVTALGTLLIAVTSKSLMAAVAIAGMGLAALAVTDTLGITATGFGDLFNAIRVDGTGVGTWLAAFFLWMVKAWNTVTSNLAIAWDAFVTVFVALQSVWAGAFAVALGQMVKALGMFASVADLVLNSLIELWNKVAEAMELPKLDLKSNVSGTLKNVGQDISNFGQQMIGQSAEDVANLPGRMDKRAFERDKRNAELEKRIQGLFLKDPQDGTKGISGDTSRAKSAIEGMGKKIQEMILAAMAGFKAPGMPNTSTGPFGGADPNAALGEKRDPNLKAPEISAVGTFSGLAAGQLSGQGVWQSQLDELRQIKTYMQETAKNTGNASEGMVFS